MFGDASTNDLHEAMERTRKAGMKLNFDKYIDKSHLVASLEIYTLKRE